MKCSITILKSYEVVVNGNEKEIIYLLTLMDRLHKIFTQINFKTFSIVYQLLCDIDFIKHIVT